MPAESSRNRIQFHYTKRDYPVPNRLKLKKFLAGLFKKEGKRLGELHYIFCDDEYLLKINQSFLQHDFYTDIISFDLSEREGPLQGEIYISLPRVRENASAFQVSVKQELHRVLFHGALHLCGYQDKSPREIRVMRRLEDKYLGLYLGNT